MRLELLIEIVMYRVHGDVGMGVTKDNVGGKVEGGSTPPQTPDGALAGSGGV